MSGKTTSGFDTAISAFSEFVTAFLELVGAGSASSNQSEPSATGPKQPDMTELAADRDRALEPANTGLQTLSATVATIAEPALAKAPQDRLAALEQRRDALSAATSAEALQDAVRQAPTLVADIGTAAADATAAAETAKRVADHRGATKAAIDTAEVDLAQVPSPAQGTLPSDLAALRGRLSALDAAEAAALETDALKLQQDAEAFAPTVAAARELAEAAEQQRAALQQVDASIVKLETALAPIAGTIAGKPTEAALPLLKQRRESLANAAALADLGRETAAAPALVRDIGAAETAATQAGVEWQALAVRKSAVDGKLVQARAVIDQLTAKGSHDVEFGAAQGLVASLATATDVTTYADTMTRAESAVAGLVAGSAGSAATEAEKRAAAALSALTLRKDEFDQCAGQALPACPVSAVLTKLTSDKADADKLTDNAAKGSAYDVIAKAATKAEADCAGGLSLWNAVFGDLNDTEGWVTSLAAGGAKTTLEGEHAAAMTTCGDLLEAVDQKTFDSGVAALRITTDQLFAKVTAEKSDQRKANTEREIAALDKIATGKPFDQWLGEVKALKATADSDPVAAARAHQYQDARDLAAEVTDLIDAREQVEQDLAGTKGWIDDDTGAEKARLQSELATAEQDLADLETETDRGKYEAELKRLIAESDRIREEAKGASAPAMKAKAELAITALEKVAQGKPFDQWLGEVKAAKQAADLEPDAAKQTDDYQDTVTLAKEVTGLIKLREHLSSEFKLTKGWIDDDTGAQKGTLESDFATGETELADLTKETDRAAYQSECDRLQGEVDRIFEAARAASAPAKAEQSLTSFEKLVAKFKGIKEPNPVKTEYTQLQSELAGAASLSEPGKTQKLLEVDRRANEAWRAATAKAEVDRKVHLLQPLIATLTETSDRAPFKSECKDDIQTVGYRAACGEADIPAMIAKFKALEAEVDKIEAKINDKLASLLDVGAANVDVTNQLAAVKAALDKIADGTKFDDGKAKQDYADEHAALLQSQVDAGTLTAAGAEKKALFALGRDALDLLARLKKAEFALRAKTPDGLTKIAEEIAAFGKKTTDPAQQAVCKAALEACFKLEVNTPPGMSVTALPTIFKMFSKVPADHLGHDKLTKLEYETDPEAGSSYYQEGGSKIVLNKIHSAVKTDYEYDMVDQSDSSKKVTVNYLKATTLHEIGHGVDAKNKVMSSNMTKAEFGGWKKETTDSVTTAVYTQWFAKFKSAKVTESDLIGIVKTALTSGKSAKPTAMADPAWAELDSDSGFKTNLGLCTKMRDPDTSPWEKPAPLPDGRCYHEGYAADWYSYLHAERTGKGVSDYQWRAPPEWFAELYALHYLKKKDVPPSVASYIKKPTT